MPAYPKAKFRPLMANEQGDARNPGSGLDTNRWPYITTVVNSAAEEAALDPALNWVDDPNLIPGESGSQVPYA